MSKLPESGMLATQFNESSYFKRAYYAHQAAQVKILLRADASVPIEKFAQLLAYDTDAARAWECERAQDWDGAFNSEITLAIGAAKLNWSDQEIADLLVTYRRTRGRDLGLGRVDRYKLYIVFARDEAEDRPSPLRLREKARAAALADLDDVEHLNISRTREVVGILTGLPVRWLLRDHGERCSYVLDLNDGRQIWLGHERRLREMETWRGIVYENNTRVFDMSTEKFNNFIAAVMCLCVDDYSAAADEVATKHRKSLAKLKSPLRNYLRRDLSKY